MIRQIEIIYRRRKSVWARNETYNPTPNVKIRDGETMYKRVYPKGTPTKTIWEDVRNNMIDGFFALFYPALVWQTNDPDPKTTEPHIALQNQSKHIQRQLNKYPEFYEWNQSYGKWHMKLDSYVQQTVRLGGHINIAISNSEKGDLYDYTALDQLQKEFSGQTKSLILFVYPDKYDDEVRALFEIRITFW
jgi:hypothetical protein